MVSRTETKKTTDAAVLGQWLVEAAGTDTVYADVYLQRARELLGGLLPPEQYAALQHLEREIAETVRETRTATMQQDWAGVDRLTGQVEALRRRADEQAALRELGTAVYAPGPVAVDPFSPGLEGIASGREEDPVALRDALVQRLQRLAAADAARAALYEARRAFFQGLGLLSARRAAEPSAAPAAGTAELERLAAQAAQQGDMAQLRRVAQELMTRRARQAQEEKAAGGRGETSAATPAAAADRSTYACPIDLAAPFPAEAVARGEALGLVAATAAPLPEATRLIDYVQAQVWQPAITGPENEREGAMRIAAVVGESGLPAALSAPAQELVAQFLRNPFINSGGARYVPQIAGESVLIEAFAEGAEAPPSALLDALHLDRRRGLARSAIDDALRVHGAGILAGRLGLDPVEFRLLCIPHDLYMRCGRERGWGQHEQWTHFDGYQVLKNGTLRALIGGDVRYGGLTDLLSIARSDEREHVVARFAVVRRARQVARWR